MFFLLEVIYCISEEEKMLDAVNAYRATKGKPPYTRSAMLDKAAQEHTEYMASINAIQHNGPLGSESHRIRIMNQGYKLAIRNNGKPNSAENVAFSGKPGANYVNIMNRWKKSPKHNAAILGDFTQIGIGYVMDTDGIQYWTQVFGVPEKGSDQDDRGGQDDGSGVAPGTEKEIPAFGGPDSISGVSKAALPRNPFSPDGNYRSLFGGFANLDAKSRMANLQRYMEATRGISMF